MKMVSRLALAAMLSLGATAFVATPAVAQKKGKKDEQEAPQLQVSKEFREAAAKAEKLIAAKDFAGAEPELTRAEAVAKNDDEKYFAAALRVQIEANKKSNAGMQKALDVLLSNPKTPARSLPNYNVVRGRIAVDEKRFAEALPFLLRARELGVDDTDLTLMLARAYVETGKVREGVAEVDRAIQAEKAAGRKPREDWYSYAVAKTYGTGDRTGTANWLMRQVSEYPSAENWRKVLLIYRDSVDAAGTQLDKNEQIDLFRVLRAANALASQQDYFDYSNAALQVGLPWEAVSVIDLGRNKGVVPKAGNVSFDRVYSSAQTAVKNEGSLDALAKQAAAAKDGNTAAQTADAYLASGNYAKAIELYDLALQKKIAPAKVTITEEQVQLHRGVALYHLGRKDEAKAAFALVKGAPLSDIAGFWIKWIDMPAAAAAPAG